MYYKVLMEGGHMGAGNSYDMCRYFSVSNVGVIFDLLKRMPRLKSKGSGRSVKLIEPISKEEYRIGRSSEARDPYLTRH